MSKWEYTETELWRHGEDISLLHVFGLIAVGGGTVLAFTEARYGNGGDADCTHDIWMRKSSDGGKTFADTVCICPGKDKHCWTNPVPVYDRETKRLFLLYSDNLENRRTDNFIIHSDDLGETWSAPERLNSVLENWDAPAPFHLAGPGHGIQLTQSGHAGRLVVPIWHRAKGTEVASEDRGYCISVLYSDDHGNTWQHTQAMGHGCMANESRIVETREGLLWVIRPGGGNPCRYESRSLDGGMTWSACIPQASGMAANCDAGAVALAGKPGYEDMVLVSRISRLPLRRDMEILISVDGGRTFADRMALPEGDAMPGYSDLAVIDGDEPVVGLVHCRSNHVLFSRISLQALTGGKYEHTKRSVWL